MTVLKSPFNHQGRSAFSTVFFVRFAVFCAAFSAIPAFAAEGGLVTIVNWYHTIATSLLGEEQATRYWTAFASAGGLLVLTAFGMFAGLHKLEPEKMSDEELLPPKKFGFRAAAELFWAVISSTLESVIGDKWQRFVPLLGGTFMFIILTNLSGLVPGFTPATEHMNQTLACAIVIFLMFNYYGFKYAGLDYVKHLAGPILFLAPLIFVIELISLFARPVSLSLRLFGNIYGDHLVFQVFSTLVRDANVPFVPVPAALLGFGTLVACLQPFIFMTLSAVYVRLALDTAHHGDDHH